MPFDMLKGQVKDSARRQGFEIKVDRTVLPSREGGKRAASVIFVCNRAPRKDYADKGRKLRKHTRQAGGCGCRCKLTLQLYNPEFANATLIPRGVKAEGDFVSLGFYVTTVKSKHSGHVAPLPVGEGVLLKDAENIDFNALEQRHKVFRQNLSGIASELITGLGIVCTRRQIRSQLAAHRAKRPMQFMGREDDVGVLMYGQADHDAKLFEVLMGDPEVCFVAQLFRKTTRQRGEKQRTIDGRGIGDYLYLLKFTPSDKVWMGLIQPQRFAQLCRDGNFSVFKLLYSRQAPPEMVDGITEFSASLIQGYTMEAIVWTRYKNMVAFATTPEVFVIDPTAGSNNMKWPLVLLTGVDNENHNVNVAAALVRGEGGNQFDFILKYAMPIFFANVLDGTNLALADGDHIERDSIKGAIRDGYFGAGEAILLWGYWHAVVLLCSDMYVHMKEDGGIGKNCLAWVGYLRKLDNPREADKCLLALEEYLEKCEKDTKIPEYDHEKHLRLQRFVAEIQRRKLKVFRCYQENEGLPGSMCLGQTCTSRGEVENRWTKTQGNLSKKSGTDDVARAHASRQQIKAHEKLVEASRVASTKAAALSELSFLGDREAGVMAVLDELSHHAVVLLSEEIARSQQYDVKPLSRDTFELVPNRHVYFLPPYLRFHDNAIVKVLGDRLSCSRTQCHDHGLPCRHALAVGNCCLELEDLSPRKLRPTDVNWGVSVPSS